MRTRDHEEQDPNHRESWSQLSRNIHQVVRTSKNDIIISTSFRTRAKWVFIAQPRSRDQQPTLSFKALQIADLATEDLRITLPIYTIHHTLQSPLLTSKYSELWKSGLMCKHHQKTIQHCGFVGNMKHQRVSSGIYLASIYS